MKLMILINATKKYLISSKPINMQVRIHRDDDLIEIFDRATALYFSGTSYVPEKISHALAYPTKKNKIVRKMWQVLQIALYQKRKLARITKNSIWYVSKLGL